MHVPGRDEAEVAGRPAEAAGELELSRDRDVAPRAHAHARALRLAVRDHGHVAEAVVQGERRVADHDDEGAAPDGGAVHEARVHADGLGHGRGRVLARGEHAVDARDPEPRVAHGVVDGLDRRLHAERPVEHLVGDGEAVQPAAPAGLGPRHVTRGAVRAQHARVPEGPPAGPAPRDHQATLARAVPAGPGLRRHRPGQGALGLAAHRSTGRPARADHSCQVPRQRRTRGQPAWRRA